MDFDIPAEVVAYLDVLDGFMYKATIVCNDAALEDVVLKVEIEDFVLFIPVFADKVIKIG